MITLADLQPGDIGFTCLSGLARPIVWLGQKIVDATSEEESRWQHVFVVTQALDDRSQVKIVQAMPGGAEEIEIGQEHWTSDFLYVRPAYKVAATGYGGMSRSVAYQARVYVDTPYSFLDYAALAGLHLGVKNGLIRRYVTTSKHMICSQLADQAMSDAGWHVFDDGRLSQDVTPAALYRKMMTMPGQHVRPNVTDGWWENTVKS